MLYEHAEMFYAKQKQIVLSFNQPQVGDDLRLLDLFINLCLCIWGCPWHCMLGMGEYGYGFFSEKHRSTDELSSNCCNTLQQIFILTNSMMVDELDIGFSYSFEAQALFRWQKEWSGNSNL